MAEFAATYGFLPESDFPWPMWVAMATRVARFEARDLLTTIEGSLAGTSLGPFGSKSAAQSLKQMLTDLRAIAHPHDEKAGRRGGTPLNRD